MANKKQIAVVTGANRGIGLETCRQLAKLGIEVILTSRSREKGEAAVKKLKQQGLDVTFHQLDVTDDMSAQRLADFIRERFGQLDILVNNAGVYIDASGDKASIFHAEFEVIRKTMETNTFGVMRLIQRLVPLMSETGNVVNVSSGMGQLSDMDGHYPAYRISKTAVNAVTRIFAAELRDTRIKVNAVCPGWVRTDMGGAEATRSVQEGAKTIVWLATLPPTGPSGGFFRDQEPIPW